MPPQITSNHQINQLQKIPNQLENEIINPIILFSKLYKFSLKIDFHDIINHVIFTFDACNVLIVCLSEHSVLRLFYTPLYLLGL